MSIKYFAAQFTLPERHTQLTPMRVTIAGFLDLSRQIADSLRELEAAHPSKTRPVGRKPFER